MITRNMVLTAMARAYCEKVNINIEENILDLDVFEAMGDAVMEIIEVELIERETYRKS